MRTRLMAAISLRHWKERARAMLLTFLCLLLSVILLTALTGIDAGFLLFFRNIAIQTEGEYHFAFYGLEPAGLETVARDFEKDPYFSSVSLTANGRGETVLELTVRHPGPWMKLGLERRLKPYNLTDRSGASNDMMLMSYGVIDDGGLKVFLFAVMSFPLILTILCAASILNAAFRLSGAAREREFGLLACAGASGRQLSALVFIESGLYWLLSLPAGLFLGLRLLYAIEAPIQKAAFYGNAVYQTVFSPTIGILTALCAALTLWLSCRKPAKRVQKLSPMTAIRQTDGIKAAYWDTGVPAFIQNRWGVTGMLAVQNKRRFRRGSRPAVLLLTVCTGLCAALDGFRLTVQADVGIMDDGVRDLLLGFGIGVTVFLTLIGGLGLLLTIYGQMAERRRELCLLRSAGLSFGDLRKLLFWEALLRSAPSLVLGVSLGSLLSYILHQAAQTPYHSFPYTPPVAGVGLAIAITAMQIFGSVAAAMIEQKGTGIMEGLRREAA